MAESAFFVRNDPGKMALELLGLIGDEIGRWTLGYVAGAGGKPERDEADRVWKQGYAFGIAQWVEANAFVEGKSLAGKRSAESRKERHGSANPRSNREQNVNTADFVHEKNVNSREPEAEAEAEAIKPPLSPRGEDRSALIEKNRHRREQAEAIYAAYPKRVGHGAAVSKIERALGFVSFDVLIEATQAFSQAVQSWPESEKAFVPHPSTWFFQRRWEDDRSTWSKSSSPNETNGSHQKPEWVAEKIHAKRSELEAARIAATRINRETHPKSAQDAITKVAALERELQQLER